MPFYNEAANLELVVKEWHAELTGLCDNFIILLVNDGSTDRSQAIAEHLVNNLQPDILVLNKENSGHGQSCVAGYSWALNNNYDWILQIDSDGQCSPQYFYNFWSIRQNYSVAYGYRRKRQDGIMRLLFSRLLSISCFLVSGIYLKDPNVPYRLFHREKLSPYLTLIPGNFYLANVCLTYLHAKYESIQWLDIVFRDRAGGMASAGGWRLLFRFLICISELSKVAKACNKS